MKLFELENITYVRKNEFAPYSWNERMLGVEEVKIGAFDNYDIYFKKYKSYAMAALKDRKNNKIIGTTELDGTKGPLTFAIGLSAVARPYQGLGLMTKLYAYLIIKKNFVLWTNGGQSKGGRSIWEKLSKVPGVLVYIWNSKTREATSIDPNDWNGDVSIYTDEIEEEIETLEKEDVELYRLLAEFPKNYKLTSEDKEI